MEELLKKRGEEEPDLSKGHVCESGGLRGKGRYLYGVSSFLIRKRAGQQARERGK